jgi:hypothetical protein
MKKLRKIYNEFETDKGILLAEKMEEEHKELAEKVFGQHKAVKEAKEFKKEYNTLQQNIFSNVFNSAIKALGNNGRELSQHEMINMPEAKGKVFFNACHIYIRNQTLLITICGNTDTYRLEISIKFKDHEPLKKDYDITKFSEDVLEEQIIECLQQVLSIN